MLPFPDIPVVRPKLAWLATHGDEFDVLFIGSSRVEQQIIPAIFDRRASELGRSVRSFNAGVSAMSPPENAYMLEQILQRPHRRLRWVLIELMPLGGQFDPMLTGTGRMDYWHDVERMRLLTGRALIEARRTWQERATSRLAWRNKHLADVGVDWWRHLTSFFTRAVNLGRGAELISSRYHDQRKSSKYDAGGAAGDGWVAPSGPQFMESETLAVYRREFAERISTDRIRVQDDLSEEALRRMVELLRREGIGTILFLPPSLAIAQFYPARLLKTVPLFDLADAARYPALYAAENHKDGVHLNLDGARIFSGELAACFAQYTNTSPQ